ncbi:N,N-dimethylformamidase beta subunit family domain-containing protein [Brucella sp. NBRC 12950]|uniref:N,N-dimethylformamidase beta subunit family domain-containing protein n=1 Tax=Brucella sp. NBRC 12950 TaxID=2994518 RepID=UPI0024A5B933|nr:N,N-dimethylformamidase beta subunit family domain-containing protein [Brucella sp. NBRC 12950]GLU29845.1 large subunit of N,N-dimethylformamidase [Brucella sp. NBRC 12950]
MSKKIHPTRITGYADRLSARAGEELTFYVSTAESAFKAEVWRIQSIDDREGAPGRKLHPVDARIAADYPGRHQKSKIGSFLTFEDTAGRLAQESSTICFSFLPTFVQSDVPQTLLSVEAVEELALRLHHAKLQLVLNGTVVQEIDTDIENHRWYTVVLRVEASLIKLYLGGHSRIGYSRQTIVRSYSHTERVFKSKAHRSVTVAATQTLAGVKNHFTGKIAELVFATGKVNEGLADRICQGESAKNALGTAVWAAWAWGARPASFTISCLIEGGPPARLVNAPMRAVTGPRWSGRYHHYRLAEDEYDAIHFRADMVVGGDWQKSLVLPVAKEWASGVYALRVRDNESEDWIPFYVRPALDGAKAKIAFLAPTNTYLAYGNETNSLSEIGVAELSLMKNDAVEPQAADEYVAAHPELGLSIYDNHLDGFGVAYASRLRPLLNFRPFHRNWLNSSYRHFAADFYLLDWMTELGFEYDVLTDEDLHLEGRQALEDYNVVLTGSHPEYVSERMLDAVQEYISDGGNLMYLGGNGFYWTTTFHPEDSALIEVRRGNTGARNWTSPPGETVHAFSGEMGGIWRVKGRSPHRLTGIGMGAVGWGRASPYRIADSARSGPRSWIFEGVSDMIIGEEGLMLGGAAGDEIDHTDILQGTPVQTEVLASSIGHSDYFQPVIEDYTNMLPMQGGSTNPLVRADLTWLDTPDGGSVFSVGSICWIGCLPVGNYKNGVSKITENVLRRMSGISV